MLSFGQRRYNHRRQSPEDTSILLVPDDALSDRNNTLSGNYRVLKVAIMAQTAY